VRFIKLCGALKEYLDDVATLNKQKQVLCLKLRHF